MQICPKCFSNVIENAEECNNCHFTLDKVICSSCSSVLDMGSYICDSCGQYLNREFTVITSVQLSDDQTLNDRYLVLDKINNIVKDTKPNYQTFYSGQLTDETLLDKYKLLSKYHEVPQLYDAFSKDNNNYILIAPPKDTYGQDLRTINEVWSELTDREKLQVFRDWANLYADFEKNKVISSLLDLYNICLDENINIKIKVLKEDNDTVLTIKNLGEAWATLLFNPGTSYLEYSRYKIGEILRNIHENKLSNISDVIKRFDQFLETPVTEVSHSSGTHPGKRRSNNEDNFYASTIDFKENGINKTYRGKRGLYIVCDGMGGHESGEVASAKAISEIKYSVLPSLCFSVSQEDVKNLLEKSIIHHANEAIFQLNESQNRKLEKRMGTTVLMSLIIDEKIYIAHVGDSRGFLVTRNNIEQITEDHNVAMKNYRDGIGSFEDAMNTAKTAWGKVLTQALGPRGEDSIQPDINMLNLKEESYLILSSDGLTDMVKDESIHNIVNEYWTSPKNIVNALIEAANNNGGRDNITVVAVHLKPMPSLFPPSDYAEIFLNNELKMNDEIVEMVETNEKPLEGLNIDPDSE